MSGSRDSEPRRIARFMGSGVANTLLGFAVIFGLMAMGVSPSIANVAGYATGLMLSFVLSRRFVFRATGALHGQAFRFIVAFSIAFMVNFLTLQGMLGREVPPVAAQLIAAVAYTASMYVLSRLFVFRSSSSTGA